jgi:DNA repair exonuclease SbcCD nuclease subunit
MSSKKMLEKLTVIAVGDPHFQTSNIPEVNMFIERLEKLAKERQPDLIVILGDLLHTHERLHTVPFNTACGFIERMRNIAETIVLVGNHDMCNNSVYLTPSHWMNPLKEWGDVEIVDTVLHKDIKGFHLVFCPYVYPGRFQEALNSDERDWKDADCIFAHQEFYGCKMGAMVSVDGDRWPEDYPEVLSGHIHSRQNPQKNIYYCGSSMQHAFGESEQNIIPILTFSRASGTSRPRKYKLEEVDLELPRKRIVYTDVESMEDYKVPEAGDDGLQDKVKITISGVYDEFKAFKKTKKYRELIKTGTKVVFKPKKITKEEQEKSPEVNETDFAKILTALVTNERNPFLYQAYELIINSKTISEEDILFT